jgi:S-DNA-T family DNA segregation ATPase FtsK/SpoIIIE
MRICLTLRTRDCGRDLEITAPAGSSVSELLPRLTELVPATAVGLWSGSRRLALSDRIGEAGLRAGDIVSAGRAGDRESAAGAVLRLHVVGGPASGQVIALPRGVTTIGRADDCDLVVDDADVSRQHASITVTSIGITVRDLDSTNGTTVDAMAVDCDGAPLEPGAYIQLGESTISVAGALEPAAALITGAGGARLLNRPPRLSLPIEGEVIMPERPAADLGQRIQWLAALLPALAGVGLALVMHNVMFLAFALLSPVLMLATGWSDRLHRRRTNRRDRETYSARQRAAEAERVDRLALELRERRRAHPDPAAILRAALTPDCRVWERHRPDRDLLEVRLGLAEQPSRLVTRSGVTTTPAGQLPAVPVVVDLRAGPLGICGPHEVVAAVSRWTLSQLTPSIRQLT